MDKKRGLQLVVETIFIQLIIFSISIGLITYELHPLLLILSASALGYGLALSLSHNRLWCYLNTIAPIFVFAYVSLSLSIIPVAIISCLLFFAFLPSLYDRVPYYPSNPKVVLELKKIIQAEITRKKNTINFIDLGSGSGALISVLAKNFPEHTFTGVELSPLALLFSKLSIFFAGLKNAKILAGSFWKISLDKYDIIYAFLSPEPMPELEKKLKASAKENALFITNTFKLPGHEDELIKLDNAGRSRELYIYRL